MTNKPMTAEDRSIMLANFLFADPAADITDEIEKAIRQAEHEARREIVHQMKSEMEFERETARLAIDDLVRAKREAYERGRWEENGAICSIIVRKAAETGLHGLGGKNKKHVNMEMLHMEIRNRMKEQD